MTPCYLPLPHQHTENVLSERGLQSRGVKSVGEQVASELLARSGPLKSNHGVGSQCESFVLSRISVGEPPTTPAFRRYQKVQAPAIRDLS